TGNAVAIGGPLSLGPEAHVHGDAVAIGGPFTRDPGARIGGKVVDIPNWTFNVGGARIGRWAFRTWLPWSAGAVSGFSSFLALITTLARLLVDFALVALVL